MKEVRIVKRTFNGKSNFVIQQKNWLFRYWQDIGSDGWSNAEDSTFEEAKDHLVYFDGTKIEEEVVYHK